MDHRSGTHEQDEIFNIGSYTAEDAARLLETQTRTIRRWMAGYDQRRSGKLHSVPPLWTAQHDFEGSAVEIGFRDLIELRFVKAFLDAGVPLITVRNCLAYARECVDDVRPFSTRRFQTDGRTIFLEGIERSDDGELIDLRQKQYVLKTIIEKSFKDLDIEEHAVARWRPYRGKRSIVIDPTRSFGQPIAALSGIPTVTLADAVEAEGSVARVAQLFEVPQTVVRDAVTFERSLRAA